jgi:hypothetical protein
VTERNRLQISYDLDDVVRILRAGRNRKLREPRRLRAAVLDDFLLSGRLNSVLGLDGFRIFKDALHRLTFHLNDADFGPHLLGADDVFQALLASGVHYTVTARAPLAPTERRLIVLRHAARHFAALSAADFALLTARFVEARGAWTHVGPGDSAALRALADDGRVFEPVSDARAVLRGKTLAELRAICAANGVAPARSIQKTIDRLVAGRGPDIAAYLGNVSGDVLAGRRLLTPAEPDLATGADLVDLHAWLRAAAEAMRADLLDFLVARRRPAWLLEGHP